MRPLRDVADRDDVGDPDPGVVTAAERYRIDRPRPGIPELHRGPRALGCDGGELGSEPSRRRGSGELVGDGDEPRGAIEGHNVNLAQGGATFTT